MRIPNLFTQEPEARRLYGLLLAHLCLYGRHADIVQASRKIRRHARNSVGIEIALFTYETEKEALWYLKRPRAAWQQQLRYEVDLFGEIVDLEKGNLDVPSVYYGPNKRSPILYSLDRFAEAATCREICLDFILKKNKTVNENIVYEIVNSDKEPTCPVRVTLKHIYDRMGKSLEEWDHWSRFIDRINGSLLKSAGINRKSLRADSSLLNSLSKHMISEAHKRNPRRPIKGLPESRQKELIRWFPILESMPFPKKE